MDLSFNISYGDSGVLSRSQYLSPLAISNSYQLALKHFLSRKFQKSYELIKPLYTVVFDKFANGALPETLFVKVVNLYLLEIGLYLDGTKSDFKLPKNEYDSIIQDLSEDKILINLEKVYVPGFIGKADYTLASHLPSEVLFNLFLTVFVNRSVVFDNDPKYSKFLRCIEESVYNIQDQYKTDPFAAKIIDLYVFEVLPLVENFQKARAFVKLNEAFKETEEESVSRLDRIEAEIETKRAKEKKERDARLAKRQQEERIERERKEEQKKQLDLKYRTLNEIKKASVAGSAPIKVSGGSENDKNMSLALNMAQIQSKVAYLSKLLGHYVQDNYQVMLIVILAFLLGTRYIRSRKINLRKQIIETLRMAFKVSYI